MKAIVYDDNGKVLTEVGLIEKAFKSGKTGFWGQARVTSGEDKFQIQTLIINRSIVPHGAHKEKCDKCGQSKYVPDNS